MENEEKIRVLFQNLVQENLNGGKTENIVHPRFKNMPVEVNEAINVLRGNLQLSGYNIRAVAITSSLAHEGKTSISFQLAKSLSALSRKTVFMDCDIRNSNISVRLGIEGETKGLTEFLCGAVPYDKIIYGTEDPCLDMIFTGAKAPNPSELLSGSLFEKLMNYLKANYEYVIVDTPPLNLVIDGLIVAKQCDGAVLVVEEGKTDRIQAEKARQQLLYADIRILGAVLNKAAVHKHNYGYGYYYGTEQGKSGKKKRRKHKKQT